MAQRPLRIGLIGAGKNMRARHIPGLLAQPEVQLLAVCNRRPESTAAVAREYGIPRTYRHWEEVLADPDVDAVVIGTWPNLHCPITVAALAQGKHVLTEARMSRNLAEARQMLQAAARHPEVVAQLVPSPYGLKGHRVVRELLAAGYLGELREVQVVGCTGALADPSAPLSWRQDAQLSGYNALMLGIVHETLLRWVPPPRRVLAQAHAFVPSRVDPESGVRRPVGTPDSVQVLAVLEGGARASYHLSGATPFGEELAITLYGTHGVLHYDLLQERLFGASRQSGQAQVAWQELQEIPIPPDKVEGWHVEADFVASIRTGAPVEWTDFATGVAYMEFTEAVARSARSGAAVLLPLEEEEGSAANS